MNAVYISIVTRMMAVQELPKKFNANGICTELNQEAAHTLHFQNFLLLP
jgi:hypothetical protein